MTLEFKPPAKDFLRYALYIPGAYNAFHMYRELGAAKVAWHFSKWRSNGEDSLILENIEGRWFVLYRIPAGTFVHQLPWMKKVQNYPWNSTDIYKPVPMTADEYAEFRVAVDRELRSSNNKPEITWAKELAKTL